MLVTECWYSCIEATAKKLHVNGFSCESMLKRTCFSLQDTGAEVHLPTGQWSYICCQSYAEVIQWHELEYGTMGSSVRLAAGIGGKDGCIKHWPAGRILTDFCHFLFIKLIFVPSFKKKLPIKCRHCKWNDKQNFPIKYIPGFALQNA